MAEAQDVGIPEILQIIHRIYRKKKRQSKSSRIHFVNAEWHEDLQNIGRIAGHEHSGNSVHSTQEISKKEKTEQILSDTLCHSAFFILNSAFPYCALTITPFSK